MLKRKPLFDKNLADFATPEMLEDCIAIYPLPVEIDWEAFQGETMSTLRCKVRAHEVVHVKNSEGGTDSERVKLGAVYGKDGSDNAQWSKWTPSASFEMTITNPEAFGKLSSGHEFFVDFTPAPKEKNAD